MVGFKVIIFALTLFSYTAWVQAKYTPKKLGVIGSHDLSIEEFRAKYIPKNEGIIGGQDVSIEEFRAKHDPKNVGIIGGHDVSIEETPYVVALYRNGEAKGAGSIVHEQFILTSASIVQWASETGPFQILVGSDSLSTGQNFAQVERHLCHEGYDGKVNDICLLKLRNPVTLGPKVRKVVLAEKDSEIEDGIYVNITGWGEMKDAVLPDHLQQTQVPILPNSACVHLYPMIDTNLICAYSDGHDICRYDSGGPMMYNNVQIGVALFNYSNFCGKRPSIYTKVSKYLDWIQEKISRNL